MQAETLAAIASGELQALNAEVQDFNGNAPRRATVQAQMHMHMHMAKSAK